MAVLSSGTTKGIAGEENTSQGAPTRRGWFRILLVAAVRAFALVLVAWCALISRLPEVRAQSELVGEYQVKAAFLYNFAKFVEWPADTFSDTHAAIQLCVMGEDPFGDSLEQTVRGKAIHGRPFAVKRLQPDEDPRLCQILFISSSEKQHLTRILGSVRGSSVLTVGDTQHFARLGGIINFVLEESKVRFEINANAAERARLKISAKLLSLARIVAEEPHGGKS